MYACDVPYRTHTETHTRGRDTSRHSRVLTRHRPQVRRVRHTHTRFLPRTTVGPTHTSLASLLQVLGNPPLKWEISGRMPADSAPPPG
eukprot:7374692-Prymnesium_polylepis.1